MHFILWCHTSSRKLHSVGSLSGSLIWRLLLLGRFACFAFGVGCQSVQSFVLFRGPNFLVFVLFNSLFASWCCFCSSRCSKFQAFFVTAAIVFTAATGMRCANVLRLPPPLTLFPKNTAKHSTAKQCRASCKCNNGLCLSMGSWKVSLRELASCVASPESLRG